MLIYNKNKAVRSFQTGGSTKRNRDWADWADDGISSFFSPSTVSRKPADTWALRTPNTSVAPPHVAASSPQVPINQAHWGNPTSPPALLDRYTKPTTSPYLPGYTAGNSQTSGVDRIKRIQRQLGVAEDGIWGPKTQAAFEVHSASTSSGGGRTGDATTSSISGRAGSTDTSKSLPSTAKRSANTDSRIDRIKMIQRRLGVKDDGLWGAKTQAAFEAMKETQRSLGFTGKDVDGIYGKKTQAALDKRVLDKADSDKRDAVAMSDMEDVEAAIKSGALKRKEDVAVAVTTDTRSKRDIRKDDIAYRRALRAAEKERGFASRRVGGIFYCSDS